MKCNKFHFVFKSTKLHIFELIEISQVNNDRNVASIEMYLSCVIGKKSILSNLLIYSGFYLRALLQVFHSNMFFMILMLPPPLLTELRK